MTTRSAYAELIDETHEALRHRAANFRRLVAGCTLVALASTAVALLARDPVWLLGLAGLPLGVGMFMACDLSVLHAWRDRVMTRWCLGTVRRDLLIGTLRQVPQLPRGSLDGMLSTLPDAMGDGASTSDARLTIATAQATLARVAREAVQLKTLEGTAAVAIGAVAWHARSAASCGAMAGLLLLHALWWWWAVSRVRRSCETLPRGATLHTADLPPSLRRRSAERAPGHSPGHTPGHAPRHAP